MNPLISSMQQLSAAEEFFEFFGVEYAPQVVRVNRLHILKRFQQYLAREPVADWLPESGQREAYRNLLQRAYLDFVASDAVSEKVFKVFQDAAGVRTVSVGKLKASLAGRRA